MARLDGKVAIITGGAGGIGQATARLFVAEGAMVVLVDVDAAALQAAVAAIGGERVSAVAADVTSADDSDRYVRAAIERHSGIDILFANAGVEGVVAPLVEQPDEAFDRVMAVNVRGVWLGVTRVMAHMQQRGAGGSIIITSSIAGVRGSPMLAPYATSKHAVIGLMRSAALAGAADGIRVNTVNPSPVETRMMRSIEAGASPAAPERAKAERVARTPLGRYGLPEEVAQLVLFLASDESRYCTGGVYMIDGGLTA
ncbi:MAG: SDR family oxidoreductase [Chloroflexi bacterium]|nr:SDR family oxidoreductase [Chloroflexota bacterium]